MSQSCQGKGVGGVVVFRTTHLVGRGHPPCLEDREPDHQDEYALDHTQDGPGVSDTCGRETGSLLGRADSSEPDQGILMDKVHLAAVPWRPVSI